MPHRLPPRRWPLVCLVTLLLVVAPPIPPAMSGEAVGDSPDARSPSTDVYGDPIPNGAAVRLGTERFRVQGSWRNGIAFSRDGSTLVSITETGELRWWDALTGRLRKVVNADLNARAVATSPDGTSLAFMGFRFIESERRMEHAIQTWDVDAAKYIDEVRWEEERECRAMAYTPDGKSIITGNSTGVIRIWDLTIKEWLLDFQLPEKRDVNAIAVSPDGQLIAAATSNNLFIWKWLEGEEPQDIEGFERVVTVAFSPNSKLLAVSRDRFDGGPELVLWDVSAREVTREFRPPVMTSLRAQDLKFSSDGKLIAVPNSQHMGSKSNNALLVWNVESGELVHRLQSDNTRPGVVAISRDQQLIAAISESEVAVWDLESGDRLANDLVGHTAHITSVRFTPDDARIITGCDDGAARIWDAMSGKPLGVLRHEYWIRTMSISPDGRWVATSSLDDTVRLWNLATGEEVYRLPGHGAMGGHRAVEFSRDSLRFASWGDDMYLRVWDINTGKALLEEQIKPGGKDLAGNEDGFGMPQMKEAVLATDASKLLVWTYEGAFLFNATTGKEIKKIPSEKRIEAACFTPDAAKLLFARAASEPTQTKLQDGRTRFSGPKKFEFALMNLEDNSILWRLGVEGRNGPMAVSSDGKLIAVSTRLDGFDTAFFLNATTGEQLATIPKINRLGWSSNGLRMAFSQDGERFAACLQDTTALVWKLSDLGIGD